MADAIAFVAEMLLRIFFEAVFEGIWYGLKRLWYALTGISLKSQNDRLEAMARHQHALRARRVEANNIRRKHGRKEKRYD